ncbi:hypothetical protein BJ742DRAFT_741798 [Cladochytrium replicatum]|nr:hypothetical protein BJ742DRAFT_741798 [Cladochytrium replicatum]
MLPTSTILIHSKISVQLPSEIIDHFLILLGTWPGYFKLAFKFARLAANHRLCFELVLLVIPSMDTASRYRLIDVLNLYNNANVAYDSPLDIASIYGHIGVLRRWKGSPTRAEMDHARTATSTFWTGGRTRAVSRALGMNARWTTRASLGRVRLLDWWRSSGFELKYTRFAMDFASESGSVKVLDWWRASNLPDELEQWGVEPCEQVRMCQSAGMVEVQWTGAQVYGIDDGSYEQAWDSRTSYFHNIIQHASVHGYVGILEWWKSCSEVNFKFSERAVIFTTSIPILEWRKSSGFTLNWTHFPTEEASLQGTGGCAGLVENKRAGIQLDTLCNKRCIQCGHVKNAIDQVGVHGHTHILDWWLNSGLPLKWTKWAMDLSSKAGKVNVLAWWYRSGLELKWTVNAMTWASSYGHRHVLDWRVESGLELLWNPKIISIWNLRGEVLDWWLEQWLSQKH